MFRLVKFVGAVAIASGIALSSGTASAGTGQCYSNSGRPIGPTYDTDRPNTSFHRWVKYRGGYCRRIGNDFWGSNNRPYPRAYLAWRQGGGYGRPGYGRPGYGRPGYGGYGRPGYGRPGYGSPPPGYDVRAMDVRAMDVRPTSARAARRT